MILFCGIPSEPPLKFALDAARAAGLDHVVFNQRDSHYVDMTIGFVNGRLSGCLKIKERCYPLERFSGVYMRLMEWQHLPENQTTAVQKPDFQLVEKSRFLTEVLVEWTELTTRRVLNRVSATASNASKPYQARIIRECGFETPTTLITNDPQAARRFFEVHPRVVYKSISSIRSIVRELEHDDLAHLDRVRALPTQFQAFVPGTNIRVHVVGKEVFATWIETDAVDYRYAGRDDIEMSMEAVELPPSIEERCVQLSKRLELPLCGIDLKRTPEDEYYCFEVNPSPAYTYYQDFTGQPIAEAIVQWLAHGEG